MVPICLCRPSQRRFPVEKTCCATGKLGDCGLHRLVFRIVTPLHPSAGDPLADDRLDLEGVAALAGLLWSTSGYDVLFIKEADTATWDAIYRALLQRNATQVERLLSLLCFTMSSRGIVSPSSIADFLRTD